MTDAIGEKDKSQGSALKPKKKSEKTHHASVDLEIEAMDDPTVLTVADIAYVQTDYLHSLHEKERPEIRTITLGEGVEELAPLSINCKGLIQLNLPKSLTYLANTSLNVDDLDVDQLHVACYRGTYSEIIAHYYSDSTKQIYYCGESEKVNLGARVFGPKEAEAYANEIVVRIPYGYTSIGAEAFRENKTVQHVIMPDTIQFIKQRAFANCESLRSVHLSRGLLMIGFAAFDSCYKLSSVRLPDGLVFIGSYAFWYCRKLNKLALPQSLRNVGSGAFAGTSVVLEVKENNPYLSLVSDCLLTKDGGLLYVNPGRKRAFVPPVCVYVFKESFYNGSIEEVILNDGVQYICEYAIRSKHDSIRKVFLPKTISWMDEGAFKDITSIVIQCEEKTIEDKPELFQIVEKWKPVHTSLQAIIDSVLAEMRKIDHPCVSGIPTIPKRKFSGNSGFKEITIANVCCVSEEAFSGCMNLRSVTIETSIDIIDAWAFANCVSLERVSVKSAAFIGDGAVAGATDVIVEDNDCAYTAKDGMLIGRHDGRLIWVSPKLKSTVYIPDSVVEISSAVFLGCAEIESVIVPDSVTYIGDWAFLNCAKLKRISLSRHVGKIGFDVFEGTHMDFAIEGEAWSATEEYANERGIIFLRNEVTEQ